MVKQVFTIYCHEDADGGIAAAIFSKFISEKYGKYGWGVDIVPMGHSPFSGEWLTRDISFPCAIIDFNLHVQFLNDRFFASKQNWLKKLGNEDHIPKCYWIDHHATGANFSFINPQNVSDVLKNACVIWDITANSSPGILRNNYDFLGIPKAIIEEYEEYIDYSEIIDGALYASPEAAHDFSLPEVKIHSLFSMSHPSLDRIKLFQQIVNFIANDSDPGTLFDSDPLFSAIIEHERSLHVKRLLGYSKYTVNLGNVSVSNFLDGHDYAGLGRFLPYMLFPEIEYAIHILPRSHGTAVISCGINPWKKSKNTKHLGDYFAKYFNGGGHQFVAGGKIIEDEQKSIDALVCFLMN